MVDAFHKKKKQTITSRSFNCVKIRYLSSHFFRIFSSHIVGKDNGIIDFWDPSTWTALWKHSSVVIRTADKNTSRVEICTVCEYEHYPFFHCGSAHKASMKRNTSSVAGFIVVALYNTSNTLYNCCRNENFKVVQQTIGRKSSLDES